MEAGDQDTLEEDAMKRMWEKTYTCTFSNIGTATTQASAPAALPISTCASGTLPIEGLGESIPCLAPSSFVAKALLLLRLLSVINQSLPDSVRLSGELFVNEKLNSKLRRQLQDPLVMCGGSLPEWCSRLPAACRSVFTFETRQQLFHLTAFGTARAMQVIDVLII